MTAKELKGDFPAKTYVILPLNTYSGSKIREIRMSKGMTQSIFANYMGVSIKTVEAWEGERSKPSGTAKRLLSILESDIEVPFTS